MPPPCTSNWRSGDLVSGSGMPVDDAEEVERVRPEADDVDRARRADRRGVHRPLPARYLIAPTVMPRTK